MKFSNKSSGGPAKAAVISSGLMGMISGSAVANVATTGVMTIPMMKKIGYEPEEAGAVEAVASTGGQIMPPIMGVGAFIMAEMLGIQYSKVAAAAIIPAIAYYFAVFVLVDRIAAKHASTKGMDTTIEVKRSVLKRLYLLIPAVVLVVYIIKGASLMRAGMMGIFTCLLINLVSLVLYVMKKGSFSLKDIVISDPSVEDHDFVDLKGIWNCCMDGAKQAAEIAIPTAACGIIINVVTEQTSLATNLAGVISGLGTSNLMLALIIAMIGCMLLGMALPTVAAYLVGVILFVPCIRPLLTESLSAAYANPTTVNLCANMFVFYYGIMAQITPPVCVASYTAAGIADGNAMKTGLKGFFFALTGFLVPFVFIYNPAILLQGSVIEIIMATAMLLVGCFFLAVTVAGYFNSKLNVPMRLLLLVAALCLISPEVISSVIGIVLGVAVLALNTISAKKVATA
jgi:TRAP transporter 4TM/12TM fusion protein